MMAFSLAWRQFKSHWSAGDLRVLFLALVLAVTATTAVGFFTDRIESALVRQGGMLLGADLMVSSRNGLPEKYQQEADRRKLSATQTMEFPSMVVQGERSQLAEIKAVGAGFPLRGELVVTNQVAAVGVTDTAQKASDIPALGTVWVEPRLAVLLDLQVGDVLEVGEREMSVSAILEREASRGGDMFSFAPRLMMNLEDVPSTGLIQYGSRVKYEFLVAGEPTEINEFSTWARANAGKGERVQDVSTARPEIRSALEKAQQFLGLSAMVGVVLAIVAMFLASLPYVQRSLDTYALMRCFGASKRLILQILLWQTLMIGLIGSLLGCLLGYFAQAGLAKLAGNLFLETLPSPTWMPFLVGMLLGFLTMLAVVWPHLSRLTDVPALRILRRDLGNIDSRAWLSYLPGVAVIAGMIFWHAGSIKLGGATILIFVALLIVTGALAMAGNHLLQRLPDSKVSAWKLGLAGLRRRPLMALAQVVGFSLGLMALILLALVRTDLLDNWQASLPADAPNRFIINIQPHQIEGVESFFIEADILNAEVFPMVRGRLVAINSTPLDTSQYTDDRARGLAEREFNLSWAANMQSDNIMLEGRWWTVDEYGQHQVSLEQGLADTLGLKMGDELTYDIAGTPLNVKVTSIRKVEWDTMRANFFAVMPPGLLESYPATFITSFHLPLGQDQAFNDLVREYSNLTVIDVAALMEQVRGIMNKMTYAVEYVFIFSLFAGLAVLYAALVATREERVREVTLLRVLGASNRQVTMAGLAEFVCIGLLSAVVATFAASALAYYVSAYILNIPYQFNLELAILALVSTSILVPFAAWFGMRRFLRLPPRELLQSI
ncbi:MAG: FtsX-like permease family protein [Methylophilaceae bacterium]|nr:FtsX-like permease family protein [Methylophilaceae bacterium]